MRAVSFARASFALAFLFSLNTALANMASPYMFGTSSATAFSSRNIDILSENIRLQLFDKAPGAHFKVEYNIRCDSAGKQIPLLFYAIKYMGDFKVMVDGVPVSVMAMPITDDSISTVIKPFPYKLDTPYQNAQPMYLVKWDSLHSKYYDVKDLKYFEVNLSKGNHTIVVEYDAAPTTNRAPWVREYFIEYSLMPAKYWKSFGGLKLTLDATSLSDNVTTMLPAPDSGDINNMAVWNFSKLPAEELKFTFTPQISATAKQLIAFGPEGFLLGSGLLLALLHFYAIWKWRKKNLQKKYSWVVALGAFLVPFIAMVVYMLSFDIIDKAIGDAAGQYHGYTFMILILYPFIFFAYLFIAWLADWLVKRRLLKNAS